MIELFKTVLLLSGFGGMLVLLLLCLKPLTAKRFPAQWQFVCWVLVALLTLIPFYKLVPRRATEVIPIPKAVQPQTPLPDVIFETEPPSLDSEPSVMSEVIPLTQTASLWETVAKVWMVGCVLLLIAILCAYLFFLFKRHKGSVAITDSALLSAVRTELKIRRRVRLKTSPSVLSPMLVGVLFPVIYLPCRNLSEEQLRMVFRHELTHLKRGDLVFKWIAVLANAIHWFNPLLYFLTVNVGESCEVACDMAVTKRMDEAEQQSYMRTILDLLEQKEEVNV